MKKYYLLIDADDNIGVIEKDIATLKDVFKQRIVKAFEEFYSAKVDLIEVHYSDGGYEGKLRITSAHKTFACAFILTEIKLYN